MAGIHAHNVSKHYPLPGGGLRQALASVDLHVEDGEFVCLLGPSGCGKTTLLNILSGLDTEHEGTVRYAADGRSPATAGEAPEGPVVSYMFQESRLLPWMRVRDNIGFVLDEPPAKKRELVDRWLERVGLAGYGDDFPTQLSIGMQQRVAVARALAVEPDILFMDEPFSSLDELTALRMRRELLDLWAEQRCTVVFVTHNPTEAAFLADRVVIMAAGPGRITEEIDLRARLPRPRDAEDPRLWEVSREVVGKLMRQGGEPGPKPAVTATPEAQRAE